MHAYIDPPTAGHGHVVRRDDGYLARCGGPGLCGQCARELAAQHGALGPLMELYDTYDAGVWLRAPQATLGGERPVALLATADGARRVVSVLHAILSGAYL